MIGYLYQGSLCCLITARWAICDGRGKLFTWIYNVWGKLPRFMMYGVNYLPYDVRGKLFTLIYNVRDKSFTLIYEVWCKLLILIYDVLGKLFTLIYDVQGKIFTLIYDVRSKLLALTCIVLDVNDKTG